MKYYAPGGNIAYDPDKLATVKGVIVGITIMDAFMTPLIRVPTVALVIKKEDKSKILIQLAPYWHMMGQSFIYKTGQEVKAVGSLMGAKNKKYLVAKKVYVDEEEEEYRDDFGIPVWSGTGDSLADIEWEE